MPACGGGSGKKSSGKPSKKVDKVAAAKTALKDAREAEKEGDAKAADKSYKQALKLRPSHFETVEGYARFLIAEKRAQDAVRIASNFLSRSIGELKGYHLVADAQMAAKDWIGAHETLTELIELDNGDSLAFFKRGKVQIERKNHGPALKDLDKAIELDKENADFYAAKGLVLQRTDRLKEAAIELRKAVKLNGRHGEAHIVLGLVLRSDEEYEEALEAHKKAARFSPELAEAHFQLGISQNIMQDNQAAEISLKKATELDDKNATYWYAYGEVLRNLEKPKEAIEPYRKALALNADYAKAADKLGLVLFDAGDLDAAETMFTERVKTHPDEARAWFYLGQVYEKADKATLAVEAYQKFLGLSDKGARDVASVKKRLRKLKRKRR